MLDASRPVPHGLTVGLLQWLPIPGDVATNVATAHALINQAADRGADLVVLPELWHSGYDTQRLAQDVADSAQPLDGPVLSGLASLAAERSLWICAGSIAERAPEGIYNTSVIFDRSGTLRATHRKCHLYPLTGEDHIFTPGTADTVFADPELGVVGLAICFDSDFPETARRLGRAGATLILQPNGYESAAAPYWDLLYPAHALANAQWWVMVNQCGINATSELLGASRVIAPDGTIIAEASRIGDERAGQPEVVLVTLNELPAYDDNRVFAELLRH